MKSAIQKAFCRAQDIDPVAQPKAYFHYIHAYHEIIDK